MDGPEDLEENLKDKNQFPGLPNLPRIHGMAVNRL